MKNKLVLTALLLALALTAPVFPKGAKCDECLGGKKGHGIKCNPPKPKYYTKYNSQFKAIGDESNDNLLRVKQLLQKEGEDLETANGLLSAEQGSENRTFHFLINRMSADTLLNCSAESLHGKRTYGGTCNNMQNPRWGSAMTTFARIYPPSYKDKFNEPCGGLISTLPNPRVISRVMHPDLNAPDVFLTNMVPQIGQFLDHDMTLTPQAESDCCGPEREKDPDCFPINVPVNDTFYASVGQTCMSFTRSMPFFIPGVTPTREQMNGISAFVDASQVYSSNSTLANLLREHSGGRLLVNEVYLKFLPTVEQLKKGGGAENVEIFGTYAAGDARVNEMPRLTVMHTLMMREHNLLATEFENLRPDWSDEEIFRAARRLLIAQWQKIIYRDYLPVILGHNAMEQFDLKIDPGTYSEYNPSADPTIFNAFATAAYRFGHSLIPGLICMMRGSVQMDSYLNRNHYFNPSKINSSAGQGYDFILGGLLWQNSESFDRFVSDDVCNFLEKKPENNFGSDLIARNIQRGRDHGLQPYSAYRQHCNLAPLTTWEKRPAEIPKEFWNLLESLYESPQEIDLFPAGLAETAVPGAVMGPTFNCLNAEQFHSVKFGDRFFYTHKGQEGSFTLPQLAQINAINLGDIICQNSNTEGTQINVFRPLTYDNRLGPNPWISCNDKNKRHFLDVAHFL